MHREIFSKIVLYLFCSGCYFISSAQSPRPFVLGITEEINSAILNEKRVLNIYLPEGYNPSDTAAYPVTYLLDGSADEDFIHIAGLYQFNSFSWINRVPKTIVVGIANTDRKRDFTFPTSVDEDKKAFPTSGNSARFISFIENELIPSISRRYRVNGHRTIIGQSLGGLVATEILLTRTGLFNNYIIISPSIWWNNGSILKLNSQLFDSSYKTETKIYIGVGKEGLAPGNFQRVMEVDANLLADRLEFAPSRTVTTFFDYLPDENHATISHQAVFNALKKLFPLK